MKEWAHERLALMFILVLKTKTAAGADDTEGHNNAQAGYHHEYLEGR